MNYPTLRTLQDAFAFFSTPANAIDYVVQMRWQDGIILCPTCGSKAVTWMPSRSLFQCKARHPKRQFSVKVGTIFEDSPIALGKWLIVDWMLGSCRNGISSYEVKRTIGVTQKSAWFMLHRLREAMKMENIVLSGMVEADESYVGGRIKNKHQKARKQGTHKDKTPVFGMVERGGFAVATVTPDAKEKTILPVIQKTLDADATLITDTFTTYDNVRKHGIKHLQINHQQDFFVRGSVHTNSIENLWSSLKRTLGGTYISVRPQHLNAYVTEQVFRHNHRFNFIPEERRLVSVLDGAVGRRLTYKELIARSN